MTNENPANREAENNRLEILDNKLANDQGGEGRSIPVHCLTQAIRPLPQSTV